MKMLQCFISFLATLTMSWFLDKFTCSSIQSIDDIKEKTDEFHTLVGITSKYNY